MSQAESVRILVAEDDLRIRIVLERLLAVRGHEVVSAVNGREALDLVDESGPFDLVITDVNMPELGGEELLRRLKRLHPELPVIVLTARKDPGLITEVFKDGAYRFLPKPFTGEDLYKVVEGALHEGRRGVGEAVASVDAEGWVELTAPSRQEYLDRFQDFCDQLIASRLDEQAKTELKIAVQEMGQNAIEWGNSMQEESRVKLSYRLLEDRILIRIEDEGRGFDPSQVPDPTVDPVRLIEERETQGKRPGGFGIHLARRIMDRMEYNERGNVVTMEKRFA
ncbi:MAG: response regulator [Planctomycetota bacterium]|nr:MAG: response regulator [Planctomycetota bacterium]